MYGGYTQLKDKGNEAYTRIYDPLRSEHERKYSELEKYGFEFQYDSPHSEYYCPSSSDTSPPRPRPSPSPLVPIALVPQSDERSETDSEWEDEDSPKMSPAFKGDTLHPGTSGNDMSPAFKGDILHPGTSGNDTREETHIKQDGKNKERAENTSYDTLLKRDTTGKVKSGDNPSSDSSTNVFPLAPRYSYRNSTESTDYRRGSSERHGPAGGAPPPRKSYRGIQFLKPRFDPLEGCGTFWDPSFDHLPNLHCRGRRHYHKWYYQLE